MEHMLKEQLLFCFSGTQSDMEICPVGAQRFQRNDLGQRSLHTPCPFFVAALGLVTDLQRPLERCYAVLTQKDVDSVFPLAKPFLALHHHCPTNVRVIPFLVVHALPPFFAIVLRKRYDSSPVSMM